MHTKAHTAKSNKKPRTRRETVPESGIRSAPATERSARGPGWVPNDARRHYPWSRFLETSDDLTDHVTELRKAALGMFKEVAECNEVAQCYFADLIELFEKVEEAGRDLRTMVEGHQKMQASHPELYGGAWPEETGIQREDLSAEVQQ